MCAKYPCILDLFFSPIEFAIKEVPPTATPTPIVFQSSMDSDTIIAEDGSGGCNSRGGGAASLSLIILSAAPLYILNRRRRNT